MTLYPESVAYLRDELAAHGTTDNVPTDFAGQVYTQGWCGLYAAALVEANPTWLVVAVGSRGCGSMVPDDCDDYGDGLCTCMTDHFYAMDGDGWYHDVRGIHDPDALDAVTHRMVGDTTFRCLLESWYWLGMNTIGCARDADFATWARELVATTHPANV